ncbi:NUDIX domain-containing protein [Candidatus Dojkabacteria bacterium]|uniref:NUDIX domain-containing protein n=1 Tax=Candidatus Dojkabacteria bacterium TaxID=2099670 RepID=A0A955L7S0_9BACT|nr:NUDIX domain-containing protein [Candidatus Dojkabacteria bacterium]
MKQSEIRITQASVNCVIFCGDKTLLMHRSETKEVDPGVYNVLGGKVQKDEDFISAAIREAREETGDKNGTYINPECMTYCGTFRFQGGYEKDWTAQFFVFEVADEEFPGEIEHEEGVLEWVSKKDVPGIEKVIWDLPYCWTEILDNELRFSIVAELSAPAVCESLRKSVLHEHGGLLYQEYYEKTDAGLELVEVIQN